MQNILLRLDNTMCNRLNKAVEKSPFVSRAEFIRFALDKYIKEFEKNGK